MGEMRSSGAFPVMVRSGEEISEWWDIMSDASALHGTGEMESAVAARLRAGDGGPSLATHEADLERAEQPPRVAASGPPQPAPHLRAGCRMWPLLGHRPQICLAERAPVLEPL